MIITLSGRRVKRPLKIHTAERGRRMLCNGAPVCIRQAKAPAPWAGLRYSLAGPKAPPAPSEALHLSVGGGWVSTPVGCANEQRGCLVCGKGGGDVD